MKNNRRNWFIKCSAIATLFLFATTSVPMNNTNGSQVPKANFMQSLDKLEVVIDKVYNEKKEKVFADSITRVSTISKSK